MDILAKANDRVIKRTNLVKDKRKLAKPNLKLIADLEEKIHKSTWRRDYLSQWGFHSYVISFRIKVRLTEELIDMA